jgi:hypothetical protein
MTDFLINFISGFIAASVFLIGMHAILWYWHRRVSQLNDEHAARIKALNDAHYADMVRLIKEDRKITERILKIRAIDNINEAYHLVDQVIQALPLPPGHQPPVDPDPAL